MKKVMQVEETSQNICLPFILIITSFLFILLQFLYFFILSVFFIHSLLTNHLYSRLTSTWTGSILKITFNRSLVDDFVNLWTIVSLVSREHWIHVQICQCWNANLVNHEFFLLFFSEIKKNLPFPVFLVNANWWCSVQCYVKWKIKKKKLKKMRAIPMQ